MEFVQTKNGPHPAVWFDDVTERMAKWAAMATDERTRIGRIIQMRGGDIYSPIYIVETIHLGMFIEEPPVISYGVLDGLPSARQMREAREGVGHSTLDTSAATYREAIDAAIRIREEQPAFHAAFAAWKRGR